MEGQRPAVRGPDDVSVDARAVELPGIDVPRVLGRVEGRLPGPTLLVVGGLHGNEPAGVLALRRVLGPLRERQEALRGRFVALAGNRAALRARRRFLLSDLNRVWTPRRVARLRDADPAGLEAEDREQLELLGAIRDAVEVSNGPVYVLDLHTTSGPGGPFTTLSDTLSNRAFALQLPAPLILGLEELVEGTLLSWLGDLGYVTVGFESGQHEEPAAVERAASALWLAVDAAGLLSPDRIPELTAARKGLLRDTSHLPRALEMRHRRPVSPGDGFRMEPGFVNFQRVRAGQVLARDAAGEVRAPESARILMPLYQDQGRDGFFIVREFRPFWLHVSLALRRLGAASVVHWLPGIRRHPSRPEALVVDRRVARWYALEALHLLGFRKHVDRGDVLVVVRRRFDGPRPIVPPSGAS